MTEYFRKDPWGQECVVVERNGMKQMIPWTSETVVIPEMLDALLDDAGGDDLEVKAASKQLCLQLIEEAAEGPGYPTWPTVDYLETVAMSFKDGYQAALSKHGLMAAKPSPVAEMVGSPA